MGTLYVMTTVLTPTLSEDAELVARANHVVYRDHRHGHIVGWVVCRVDSDPGALGFHEVITRVTGRANRRTVQTAALHLVQAGEAVHVHKVRACGCLTG